MSRHIPIVVIVALIVVASAAPTVDVYDHGRTRVDIPMSTDQVYRLHVPADPAAAATSVYYLASYPYPGDATRTAYAYVSSDGITYSPDGTGVELPMEDPATAISESVSVDTDTYLKIAAISMPGADTITVDVTPVLTVGTQPIYGGIAGGDGIEPYYILPDAPAYTSTWIEIEQGDMWVFKLVIGEDEPASDIAASEPASDIAASASEPATVSEGVSILRSASSAPIPASSAPIPASSAPGPAAVSSASVPTPASASASGSVGGSVAPTGPMAREIAQTVTKYFVVDLKYDTPHDIDVYGRLGAAPTTTEYDWRETDGSITDTMNFQHSFGAGTWYIGLYGENVVWPANTATTSLSVSDTGANSGAMQLMVGMALTLVGVAMLL